MTEMRDYYLACLTHFLSHQLPGGGSGSTKTRAIHLHPMCLPVWLSLLRTTNQNQVRHISTMTNCQTLRRDLKDDSFLRCMTRLDLNRLKGFSFSISPDIGD